MTYICRIIFLHMIIVLCIFAQSPVFVTEVNSIDATAYNNSHKIVPLYREESIGDTLCIVYHSSDSIYYVQSINHGLSWQSPIALYAGTHPGFDVDEHGLRHVVWQHYEPAHSSYDIYYDCLDDWAIPVNVSQSPENSMYADVVADSDIVAHITWVEEHEGTGQIFYRTCQGAMLGDTHWVSNTAPAPAMHSYPSISIFEPNYRIYIVWDCYDPGSYSPFQIHSRYKEGSDWALTDIWASYCALRHSSIDFSHGEEPISACWEDSTTGNLEAFFYEGNGGGYATYGRSEYPVISTVSTTWSYLFWQENTEGYNDILIDLYYFMTGWSNHSLRNDHGITEPVYSPNACGAYLIWTQGDQPPYSLYFCDFGYPVGIELSERQYNNLHRIALSPNPFTDHIQITYADPTLHSSLTTDIKVRIYDITGQVVTQLMPYTDNDRITATWNGKDDAGIEMSAGIYFCVITTSSGAISKKLNKLH
jgi:hypothetical protein